MIRDVLADALTRVRNGGMRKLVAIEVMKSKLVLNVFTTLKEEGYIENIEIKDRTLKVFLKYFNNQHVIQYIKKVSKGSRRVYGNTKKPLSSGHYGLWILSTNQGILTHVEANERKIGGEILLEVY